MAYFVALASAFLVLSAATALRPGRRGLYAAFAYPVGWAAGELAGQAIVLEAALLGLLWWWGWPATMWVGSLVVALATIVLVENVTLIVIQLLSRLVVRRALEHSPDRPLAMPRPRDDQFGRWWRTALQVPFHPRNMQLHRDVVYGPLPRHRLDVWRLSTTPSDAPVIFYLHGGAWTFGDKRQQARPMLHEFVERGWIVVASNYRLAPQFPWPAQIEDATRALGWIKRNISTYGGDPDRVVIAGGSAGAHLASLVALGAEDSTWRPEELADVKDWSVRGALSFYGVLEMTGDVRCWQGLEGALLRLLEQRVVQRPLRGNEDLYRQLSPYERITASSPPFFVVQGVNDTLVEVNVARAFVAKFRDVAFAPVCYVELPFTQHGFDLTASPRTSASTRAAVAFAESVVSPRPVLTASLVAGYQVPPTQLRVDLAGQSLDAVDATAVLGSFYVVTSDNPYSTLLNEETNQERRNELRRFLRRRGIAFFETTSWDVTSHWPREHGVALPTLTREDARALARAWDQFAFYEVSTHGVAVRDAASDLVLS